MKLTETIIKALQPTAAHQLLSDDATPGLYVKVYAVTGRKSWLFRTRKGGAWRVVTMGSHPAMTLNAARQEALRLSGAKLPDAMTFGQLLDIWYTKRIEPLYKRTESIQTYVAKGKQWLGNVQLRALTTRKLVEALQGYAEASPVAANRCLSNWKLALDYGVEIGTLEANPLARTTSRAVGGKEKSRDRVLTDDEIRKLWASDEPLLRFLLLTGLRISEAQQGRLEGPVWRCDVTKNKKPHWVHLPPLALDQIDEDWSVSPTAVQSKLKRWCEREEVEPFTPHDLRRTFATRLAGLGVAPHVVEKCVNHTMQGVMGVYNRHSYEAERIAAAQLWAAELQRIIDTPNKSE